ncbi:hypothetical protein K437DRAFT_283773 [Tilletiaria anomala UBC 951]|uniref:Adenylate cyclase n=1 Tax=Tilletiaria anomala (strain ATCC 24038 / CBS 436.72 / UBC 951) TaxID=1037660 RepID=A0A066W663_TILAU|nr:uncharacterized protein K437DRAFT_283773 [Tilletiaria anomala UBC 951]KDN49231.1 hypothetical protein K437DRAFT_283773 [Tilletiaria anomala UBC 951]
MTKSQYRALIKNGSDDWSKGSLVDGDEVDEPIELALTPDACRESFHDAHLSPRKDSAASGRSDHSGVSPKSPYVQLPQLFPSLVRAGQWTAGDAPAFSFPPGGLPQGQAQGQGSSSGSASASASGLGIVKGTAPNNAKASASERLQLKASNWMAPDSWAVQPDKSRAFSMEEEQDSDDDGVVETASDPTMRRDSSSGVSSAVANDRTGRTWSSGDAGTVSSISRLHLDAQRRPTQDSVSLHSAGDEPVAASQFRPMSGSVGTLPPMARRPSDIEIVHGPTWHAPNAASTWGVQSGNGGVYSGADPIPSPTPHIRPASSRGGGSALAAASGAAVTAASKLGLRGSGGRSAKAQGRPGTAGSVQGVPLTDGSRPSGGSLGTSSVDDEQISPSASMTPATSKDSARTTRRPGTATGTSAASKPHLLRIWRKEGSFVTLSCALVSTTNDIKALLTRKSLSTDNAAYRLFVRDKGNERPLGPAEKPALIQRRRLEQAGYTDADGLEDMGREDLSYLLRFVYRPDIVPTFDSESFGNEEHMFQHLDLQGRNLEMVPIFLYKHADWIVSLDLSGNPMSDVPSDFMQMCSSLRSLRLSNLALKRLPQGIRQSQTLTHLDVSNNRIPELAHISLESCQELISVKAQNNRLFDLPPWFTRVETLRYLNLSNNRFDVFPPILCEASGLMDLDISFNSIPSLPASISKLTNLQRFIFVGNSVEELPESMSALVKLQTVDLRRNLVQDVSVLFTMPQVNVVQCEHNSIRHFEATLGTKMRSLEVGQNPLTKVSLGAYSASELTSLNLSSANMAKLEEDLFKLLPSLTELVLDRNQFVTLPDTIGELVGLVSFSCTNNNLATLPDSIGSLKKLTRANIQNNNLKVLPNSIWNCSSLQRLNVTSNLLETFPSPPLLGTDVEMGRKGSTGSHTQMPPTPVARQLPPLVRSLRKLRLGDNRLGDDVFSVLTVFLELEVLNLSFNEIYEVPSTSLACYKRLRELYLSGNSLSSVPADDLVHMQELRILHLNGNKLQTLPAELGRMRKLASLDVGNNNLKYNIANWTYDWNWNSNPELRYLNLSGNKRLEIKSKIVEVNGRRKNMSDFSRLLSLRVLGLMDVTMTLQSTPDESENRRVRTSLSQVNNMAYGIADTLGKHDNLSIVDVVVPNFRKDDSECLLGLFDGRGHDPSAGSRIARHLAEWVSFRIARELQEVERTGPDAGSVADTLRRAFLRMNKEYADALIIEGQRRTSETQTLEEKQPLSLHRTSFGPRSQWKSGASAVIAYIADRTLHIANAGDALAVMSRNGGQAELISTKHEPFDRAETERIRSAEGWVSLRGFVNDMLDVSRGFGYYHLFPVVNAAPAVTSITLSDSDEFIIIANKVLWDFLSYQTAVDIARMERDDPMIAAQRLRDLAISSGAEDSIMVMIISVSDLFFARQQRSGGALLDPSSEIFKRTQRRTREPRDLPADRTLARLEREVAPPIGQVALVFTDIKNSTSLWENNGGMQSAMRLHNTLLRRQLRTVGGYEVKTEGDAFMVSFPSVSAALLWCFNVQMQLLREDWPQEILESEDGKEVRDSNGEIVYRGLWVRMGLHWGFPVCEPDPVTRRMDYFGPMVNRASRISGAADGGQILVSKDVVNELTTLLGTFGETEEITGDVDDDEFRLLNPNVSRDVVLLRRMGFGISDMGERRLKGLETPESLFLVYPKQLAGRLEADGRTIAPAAQVFEPTVQLLDIDEVKQVGMLCLRLEALSAGHVFPGLYLDSSSQPAPTAEESDAIVTMERNTTCTNATSSSTPGIPNAIARRKAVEATLAVHPELLIYAIRDDAPDEELAGILEQLIVRISNAVAKLQLDQLSAMADLGLDMASLRAQLQAFKGGV